MRIMECNHDHSEELSQKQYLRPLMPKPFTNITAFSATPTPSCFQIHNPNYISGGVGGYGVIKREMSTVTAPLVSSRWNPTPEQLQALEEMYKRGTRTPSAEQIQQIAAKLRRFGKIEGKNVFYWFQNHKARERQKKRRQQEQLAARKMRQVEKAEAVTESGLSRRYLEFEHPKKVPTPSNCSTVLENYVEECKKDVWAQLDEKEQLQTITAKSTETCSPLELSSCMPFNCSKQQQQITAHKTLGQENENPFVPIITNLRNLYRGDDLGDHNNAASEIIREDQTLQLFPVRGNGGHVTNVGADDAEEDDQTTDDVLSLDTKLVPRQFFEFLPTRK